MAAPLGAFAAGAVLAVLLGVFGRWHDPTLSGTTTLGFRTVIEMKVDLHQNDAPVPDAAA